MGDRAVFLACRRCGNEKTTADFHISRSNGRGFQYHCKDCTRAIQKLRNNPPDPSVESQKCVRCGFLKSADRFQRDPKNRNGYMGMCKDCERIYRVNRLKNPIIKARRARQARDHHLRKNYGITLDQEKAMRVSQGGLCAIRGCSNEAVAVDHCHSTGMVRGMLCHSCNVAIGLLNDDVTRARGIVAYIEKHDAILALADCIMRESRIDA